MSLSDRAGLPIFTFHALATDASPIAFPPALFERALSRLAEGGYSTLRLVDVARLVREGRAIPARTCVITFDDGYRSVYDVAWPLLSRYRITATVFVTVGEAVSAGERLPPLGGRALLSWAEMREMQAGGIDFGAHTLTHPDLTRLATGAVEAEMLASQARLADGLGAPVTTFAYPFGRYDARSRAVAAAHFEVACSDRLDFVTRGSDLYALPRLDTFYLRHAPLLDLLCTPVWGWYFQARRFPRWLRRRLA